MCFQPQTTTTTTTPPQQHHNTTQQRHHHNNTTTHTPTPTPTPPPSTYKFRLQDCAGSRRELILVALMRLLLPLSARSLTGGFLPIFHYLVASVLIGGRLRSLAPLFPRFCGLLAGLTLLIGRYLVLFRMPGMCTGMNLGLYLLMLYLPLRMRFVVLLSMIFGPSGARVRRPVFF